MAPQTRPWTMIGAPAAARKWPTPGVAGGDGRRWDGRAEAMLAGVNRPAPADTRNVVPPARAPGRRDRYRECPSERPPAADGEMLAGPAPGSDGGERIV